MDTDALIDLLNSMLKKRDFSDITNLVPYEDRFALFMESHSIKISNSIIYSWITENIFTPEEAERLFVQVSDSYKKKALFNMLSDDNKIKHVDEVELSSFDISRFLDSIKDEKIRFDFVCKFIKQSKISDYSLCDLLNKFNRDYKLQLFYIIFAYLEEKGNPISAYDIVNYLPNIDEQDRVTILKYFLENSKLKEFNYLYIDKCLKVLPYDERKNMLLYIVDKNVDSYKSFFDNLNNILTLFSEDNKFEILTELLDRGIISSFTISETFGDNSYEKNMELIDFVIDYSKKHDKKILSNYCISKLLDIVPRDIGVMIYHKYAIDSDYFDNIAIAERVKVVDDKYFYLDYLIGNVKVDDFEKAFNLIDSTLLDIEKYPSGKEEYPNIIDMYVKKYNVDRIHLREFIKRFNYIALRFMNSKSIRSVINLPDDEFVKFLNIFNNGVMLDNNIINSICNSFLQRQFRLEKNEEYSIFTQFELLLENKNDETQIKIAELLVKVGEVVNIDAYLSKKGVSFDQFVYDLINNDKDSIDLLHDMTQEYIMKQREVFVKDKLVTVFDEIGVIKKVERQTYKKKILEISNVYDLMFLFQSIPVECLTEEELLLANNSELLDKIVKFKKEHVPLEDSNDKKYLKIFESLLNKSYEYKYDEKNFEVIEGLPYSYFPLTPTDEWLLAVIVECNIKQIVDKVLSDKQVYSGLVSFIEKYKMLGWDKTFACFDQRAEVVFTEGTMASIISNFYIISNIAKEKDANLTQFLDYANCFDSLSKTYSYILGKDNYRAIAANEGKNKASMSKTERLSRLPALIKGMYGRGEITTPPIDKDYQTITGKKLNVVLGNSTNMINLSYGERTNSCLRIGGAFNNLFEFCIHDKNGFHVRFTDPETGKFISRVSGIRNGNTIFFNELRDSENPDYSNEDIIEVLNQLSSELIEATKEEDCPIDNVVITYDYAMREYEDKAVPTELTDYPNAFYGLRFNIAFDGKFVVLKTTNPDGSLVPYKFGAESAKTYSTQRDKIVTLYGDDAFFKVTQLYLIDKVLKGYEIEALSIPEDNGISICMAGEDWCVYADTQGNVHQFLVEMSIHKDKALLEMKESFEKIKEYIYFEQQSKTTGGLS